MMARNWNPEDLPARYQKQVQGDNPNPEYPEPLAGKPKHREARTLILPWPPSLNRMYRTVGARLLLSKVGRGYKKEVSDIIRSLPMPVFGTERLSVHIVAYPPDRRRRDLDNLPKCVLDSLGKGAIFTDDSQIDNLQISRAEVKKSGLIRVEIEVLR